MAKINILNPYNFKSYLLNLDTKFYVRASSRYVDFLEHWLSVTDPILIKDRGLELVRTELLKGGEIADIIIDSRENFVIRLNSVEGCEHYIFIASFKATTGHKRFCLEPFTTPVKLIDNPIYEGGFHRDTDLAGSIISTLVEDAQHHVHMPVICSISWFNALDYGRSILNFVRDLKNVMIYDVGV